LKLITLSRVISTEEGILGVLHIDGMPVSVTLERPWKDNMAWESCIPTGIYPLTKIQKSKAFNYPHYLLENVPNRTFIKIHVANYPEDLHGCIGVGSYFPHGAIAVSQSRNAMDHVIWALDRYKDPVLHIQDGLFTNFPKAPDKVEPSEEI